MAPRKTFMYGSEYAHIVEEKGTFLLHVPQPRNEDDGKGAKSKKSENLEEIMKPGLKNPFRFDVFWLAQSASGEEEWIFGDHRIDMLALLAETHQWCPRYIFRVVSDKSAGINKNEHFQSEAVKRGQRTKMESMIEVDIAENLRHHMQHKKFASHWISFTSSPLWAFDRALRMKLKGHKNIRIAIVDTLKLVRPTKIFPAAALLEAFDVEKHLKPISNRGGAEMLVWDELHAPGVLIPLDNFLSNLIIEDGVVQERYPSLQPLHFKPLTSSKRSINDILKAMGRNSAKGLYAPCYLRTKNYRTDANKMHEIWVRKRQAPKTWWSTYTAGRTFHGKKFNNWWNKNARVPISPYTVSCFIELVEKNFPRDFHFSILVALLSTRLYFFEYESVLDAIEQLKDDDPILNPNDKKYECYVREYLSPDLPELNAFENLLIECSKRCRLSVKKIKEAAEPRKFLTMMMPHTETMMFDMESENRAKDALERSICANKKRKALEAVKKRDETPAEGCHKRSNDGHGLPVLDTIFEQTGWRCDSKSPGPAQEVGIMLPVKDDPMIPNVDFGVKAQMTHVPVGV